jgi:cytochrome P450 family 12
MRKIKDKNNEMPENFFEIVNEWALESIGLIALDTRLGVFENPEKSKLNQVIFRLCMSLFITFLLTAHQGGFPSNI